MIPGRYLAAPRLTGLLKKSLRCRIGWHPQAERLREQALCLGVFDLLIPLFLGHSGDWSSTPRLEDSPEGATPEILFLREIGAFSAAPSRAWFLNIRISRRTKGGTPVLHGTPLRMSPKEIQVDILSTFFYRISHWRRSLRWEENVNDGTREPCSFSRQ